MRAMSLGLLLVLATVPSFALPIQGNIKVLLDEAKRPPARYVPARAGWNGPEAKPVKTSNATYDELRRESTPAELRQQFLAIAIPDWRIVLALAAAVVLLRSGAPRKRKSSGGKVLVFPTLPVITESDASQAA